MSATGELKRFGQRLDKQLKYYFSQKAKEAKAINPHMAELVEVARDFVLRPGKRLRPALVYYAYKACGGKDEKAIIYTSQSIELLHAFALVHDDIMDQSDLRRGKPTVHRIFSRRYKDEKLGEAMAILVGDALFSYANEVFSSSSFPDDTVRRARRYFDLVCVELCSGQYLDLVGEKKGFGPAQIEQMMEYKSGKYTIERPLHLGAALARAPKSAFQTFSAYGIPLGKAFQIQDDILGMFGTRQQVGKPVDSDLKEGKQTLLVASTRRKLSASERKKFDRIWGNQKATQVDLLWVRKKMKQTGALDETQSLAQKLIVQAKKAIEDYPFKKEGKDFFLGIADFMIERKY